MTPLDFLVVVLELSFFLLKHTHCIDHLDSNGIESLDILIVNGGLTLKKLMYNVL